MPGQLTSPPATKRIVATLSLALVVAVVIEAVCLRVLARAGIYIFGGSSGGWLYSVYSSLVWLGKVAMNFAGILAPLLLLVLAITLWQRGSRLSRLVCIAVLVTLSLEGSLFLAFPNSVLSLAYFSSSALLACLALVLYFRDSGALPMALTLGPLGVMFLASYWYKLVPLVHQVGGAGLGGAIAAFQLSEWLLLLVAFSLPITIGISRRFKVIVGSILLTLPLLGMYLGNPSMVPLIAIWAFGISMFLPFWVYAVGLWAFLMAILTLLNRGHHLPAYGLALLLASHRDLSLSYFNNLILVALLLIVATSWPLPQWLGQWRWWRSSRDKAMALIQQKRKTEMTRTVKTVVALFLAAVVTLTSCTRPIYLPSLYLAPAFTLTNQDGQPVELAHFRGKVVVMDFFYTRCPDVCGELNYALQSIWQQVKEELRQDLVLISISFDLYDTPEVLERYATFYDVPGWQFLTGTKEQIQQVTRDYGAAYEPKTAGAEPVEFVHNISVVIIDRVGMVRKTYGGPELPVKDMVRELTHLLSQQSK